MGRHGYHNGDGLTCINGNDEEPGFCFIKLEVGSKIKFPDEKQRYTVQASNRFYSICTKPLNIHKTVLYTIIDWKNKIKGVENLVFGMGAETREECEEMLERLTSGKSDISQRNWCPLVIEKIYEPS